MSPSTEGQEQFEKLMSVKEAAAFVGLKEKTLYALLAEKQIPYTKIGKRGSKKPRMYVQKSDLIQALKQLRVEDHPLRQKLKAS
jgi:excisionase family DNA binding protein